MAVTAQGGKLAGKKAIVTGGSRGIGAAVAKSFALEGAAVALVHRCDGANAERTLRAMELTNAKARCLALDFDVSNGREVQENTEAACYQLGGVDILVNCAGVGGARYFEETTADFWNEILSTNLTGAFLMAKHCYPLMKQNRWGRIINISSQLAFSGFPGAAAYCASKAGLIGFTRALAVEAAEFGVLVNAIAPGATMTDMLTSCGRENMAKILQRIPLGRFGLPEEIAPTAVLLASEEGAFYVGQTLSPNGGDVLR